MRHISTNRSVIHSDAEICLNLWYFVDDTGVVLRLAGKAYALVGDDSEKLTALHLFSGADHLTATMGKVPQKFTIETAGATFQGAISVEGLLGNEGAVFFELIEKIEKELPKGVRSIDDEYEFFDQKIPDDPLMVTTAVYERADGALVARVGVQD